MNPAKECPRWERCSVNRCPLDPGYNAYPRLATDPQKDCPMESGVRLRIGSKYPDLLPNRGLSRAEASARARYDSLTEAEKAAKTAILAEARKKLVRFSPNPAETSKVLTESQTL